MTRVRTLARLERMTFADFLDDLTSEQWIAPSLCDGWTVRDVVAHTVAYLGQSRTELAANMVSARGDVDRVNASKLSDFEAAEPDQLIEFMRRGADPSGAAALYGCRVALIECLIHQQDIRRPLRQIRTIPAEPLRISMKYARINPVIGGARRTRGVRLIATDMEWSAGRGPEVRGSGEALLLAMTGRLRFVADELDGAGVRVLRAREMAGSI
ncbi:maleylpyruvate isomerase family mycothiol-dependent enzyme [Antrihabitans spumae]|uniref:Maleylpyruvate isomerase family mycothiol-dependent enzyme n=1 Tax=Antrihabitans spumae TaxID=3373370 RepID=A0ABW7KWK9_9NOCA